MWYKSKTPTSITRSHIRMFSLNYSSLLHYHRRKYATSPSSTSPTLTIFTSSSVPIFSTELIYLLFLFVILIVLNDNKNNGKSIILCEAAPTSSLPLSPSASAASLSLASSMLPLLSNNNNTPVQVALHRIAETNQVVNITRQHGGDAFNAIDVSTCDMDTCVGLSSGTAGIYKTEMDMAVKYKVNTDYCKCQCLPHLDTFREDLNICVDDIHECTLAPFVSGSTSEKIPFVFLPLRGQIIHPSKEISFKGIKTPVCAVSAAQYLTTTGWTELRNPIDVDVPFRLFRDEGRTFLQWLGESDLRYKMQGRLILVHLMCRDMAPVSSENILLINNETATGQPAYKSVNPTQNLFSPCVAFRVVGTPIKHVNNVTEVSFQSETHLSSVSTVDGLTAKEYIVIAICSLILGLIYVASVFLYIHVKRYKNRNSNGSNEATDSSPKTDFPSNDQVTFGNGFTNNGNYSRTSQSTNGTNGGNGVNDRHKNLGSRNMSLNGLSGEEMGIVKNNPLLKHYPNLSDNSGFTSDMSNSNSNSECDDERAINHEIMKNMQNISLMHNANGQRRDRNCSDSPSSPTQETECLPEENVSIIEDMTNEDKLENMKAIVSGTMRRKLYFNPAYFEPHLLLSPPPAAVEFLTKIREVITLARYKMSTKRFQPSLIMIPEEQVISIEVGKSKSTSVDTGSVSTVHVKTEDGRKKVCSGCPGCSSNDKSKTPLSNCKNCGEKRNSIRKWLEGVSKHENDIIAEDSDQTNQSKDENDSGNYKQFDNIKKENEKGLNHRDLSNKIMDSSSSSDSDTVKANSISSKSSKKRQAPPIPSTAPKIVSHFLKRDRPAPNGKKDSKNNNNSSGIHEKNTHSSSIQTASLYDKTDIYNSLSITGSEIYNNPQFVQNSPPLSQRSRTSKHSHTSRSSRKHIEVLDQYSNPNQLRQTDMVKNLSKMPDMVYEAIAKDYTKHNREKRTQDLYGHINLPTPDYDDPNSTYSRKRNNIESDESYMTVPTPDYNTLARNKTLKQYQPDSPIYHRKSPHYLIVDYETDSLERTNTNRLNRSILNTPHSNNSSDLSSQPSPSLSSALPLEEEVEIRNAVYDRVEGFRKDGEIVKNTNILKSKFNRPIYEDISSISEAYRQSAQSSREPRIKYNTPFHGSMTIEVEHDPTDEEPSTDSDQFEPDTLDRKTKKITNIVQPMNNQIKDLPNNQRNINAWSNHLEKSSDFINHVDNNVRYSALENMTSLPDMNHLQNCNHNQMELESGGSFKSNSLGNYISEIGALMNETNIKKNFSSLREIYEAKNQKNLLQRASINEIDFTGRLLTLEARHSKRQRQTTLEKNIKKPLPPDVIPNESNKHIYDIPADKLQSEENNEIISQKNLTGWSTDDSNNKNQNSVAYGNQPTSETMSSSNSESTDITGVSDTHASSEPSNMEKSHSNSAKRAYMQMNKKSNVNQLNAINQDFKKSNLQANENYMNLSELRSSNDQSDCNSDSSTLKTSSTNFCYKSNLNMQNKLNNQNDRKEEIKKNDPPQTNNTKVSLRSKEISVPMLVDTSAKHLIAELANDTSNFNPHLIQLSPTKVFHVDIQTPSNGMQIALGIRDRVKKSKDLKNAWRKFVNMATSKFQGSSNPKTEIRGEYDLVDRASALSDSTDKDDGIASMNTCDDNMTISSNETKSNIEILSRSPSSSSSDMVNKSSKSEMDYGYISADSNESRAQHKKLYERFNFKSNKQMPSTSSGGAVNPDKDIICGNINRMQEIKENIESDRMSVGSMKDANNENMNINGKQSVRSTTKSKQGKKITAKLIDFIPKSITLQIEDAVNVNVYSSSDDERYSSGMSSESDEEYNLDECESGAESVETHSVLFKNIRKLSEHD